ncbi:MAG: hypothetical protein EBQ96_05950 [Proteobacteria bacterium]|nr:hypothetical protein [Pseudomonadota bacterium]
MVSGVGSATSGSAASASKQKPREDMSEVEKLVVEANAQKETSKKRNFFQSETYFKAKANQLKFMIGYYKNFGLTEEATALEKEASKLITEYTKLYGPIKPAPKVDKTA